jgi:hypothetical protein
MRSTSAVASWKFFQCAATWDPGKRAASSESFFKDAARRARSASTADAINYAIIITVI